MIKLQTLKGFRDFLPKEARKRQYVIDVLKNVFESYGFEPLETPALEYEEILLGKYGKEGDKLMYRFEDQGKRKVALRYDQTVPLARVVAQYGSTSPSATSSGPSGSPQLPIPFKRYQIQPVWRAENTQKGRFREFLQCDADVVGTKSVLSDAEVIAVAAKSIEKLGFNNFKILINDRSIFKNIPASAIRAIDKLKKIGREKVLQEVTPSVLQAIEQAKPTQQLKQIFSSLEKLGVKPLRYEFSPTLARGLDYYTGMIFEIEIEGYSAGSVCGGGRYDNLIGVFSGKDTPAVGFAFGFDRLMEAMEELNLFPDNLATTKVLVTIFSPELKEKSIEIASELRSNGINTELYPDEEVKLDKQLKYADQKGVPYVAIIGPNELKNNTVTFKNLKTGDQKTIPQSEILDVIE